MEPAAGGVATPSSFSPGVQQFIRAEQEKAYRNLAIRLGLGANPRQAYERLTGSAVSTDSHSPYEDPRRFRLMSVMLSSIQRAILSSGESPLDPEPVFASLPTGDVNARVSLEPASGTPVMFVEQGLFQFFYDFCHLIGWAVPPLTPLHLAENQALIEMARRYTMPMEASRSFIHSMGSYTFNGTPLTAGNNVVPRPDHNLPLCMVLVTLMERFVLAHELAHIKLGHLHAAPDPDYEYQADTASLGLVLYMVPGEGVCWGIGFWACDLALTAMNMLYRSIGIGEFGGTKLRWIDDSHPDLLARRERLRAIWLDDSLPQDGIEAARVLCGMSDTLIQRLWEMASAELLWAHQQQNLRPSPMWRDLIDGTFVPRN
jgi:hypothetical protein